ncbi:helix-turn-helix domain-containing protein [Prosthecomicrobium pneumaticum]|uniref:AraC-like DNA-binding protein n=1 Tax=Prosthecomicrobium pneumaticum TaxID=81895 RepID=A0A7W9FKH0_9HYPH|nr:AraC family transcriptional regulator [Prosthecomicrobium pneumaticum]MBB5752742.1 AraC-like DNA-binding protein [Prosthecomicrobium pneumaticum]
MTESIKLYRSGFGHVSLLNVASDFVTHAHAEAHIVVWLEGATGEMTIDRETVRLGPRLAAGINPFAPHSHALAQDGRPGLFLAFYIDPLWLRRRRGLCGAAPIFIEPTIALEPWLAGAAETLFDTLRDSDGTDDLTAYETERFIDSVLDAADAARGGAMPAVRGTATLDYRVRKAIELMRANVAERISFDQIARAVGLSRPHFFALFREQMNVTPNVFWNTLRMEEAVRRLDSEESLISVACDLGFTSPGNFSRFFRDHVGVPPTVYRSAVRAA